MPDRNAIDLRPGHDAQPADGSDRVVVAPDGGAGGWEAFDDPDAPAPPAITPDRPEPHTPTVTPAPDGGAGGWEAFDDPDAPTDRRAERPEIRPMLDLSEPEPEPGGDENQDGSDNNGGTTE